MKVLFVAYGAGHVEMCLPVMRALREARPACQVHILALTTGYAAATKSGEKPLGYRNFAAGAPDSVQALRYGEELQSELAVAGNEHPHVASEESRAYLGFNFIEWVLDGGEAAARARWGAQGRQGFLPRRFLRYVLQQERPDVVVTTNSPRSEQAAVEAAVALGIPCLSMVDLFALRADHFALRPVHADRITVLTGVVRDNLVRAGIDASRIVVTGNPAFDEFLAPGAQAVGAAWRAGRGWDRLNVVLWAGHKERVDAPAPWCGTNLGVKLQDLLAAWTRSRDDVALVVRYHPNEWHDFPPLPDHARMHWSRPDEEALLPVLMGCDQVIVQATTVGAQAHAAGKRLLCLGFSPLVKSSGMDYSILGLGVGVASIDAVLTALEAGLSPPASTYHPALTAPAASLIAAEVLALIQKGVPS